MKSTVIRAISGVALLLILGVTLGRGGLLLFLFDLLIAMIAFMEMIRITKVRPAQGGPCGLEYVGYAGILAYFILHYFAGTEVYVMSTIVMTIMGMLLIYVLTFPKYGAGQVMAAVFSFVYAPILLSYIYLTREMPQGRYLVWLIFCASWACDTSAYCVGKLFGRHKLAPILSPKKSVEGAVGGIAGAALVGFLYAYLLLKLGNTGLMEEILWAFPLISGLGSILSQLGDLAASGIKRNFDTKDYGTLIPGHGGIMDRFDSVCVTAPLIYYLSLLLLQVR